MTSRHIQAPGQARRNQSAPGRNGRILAISSRAVASLSQQQRDFIAESARVVELSIPTIELAGGSIRCMLAGIHLARRY